MKIHLHEITDVETELDFTGESPWVLAAVQAVDEDPVEDDPSSRSPSGRNPGPRAVQVHFSLRKVDEVIVVQGKVETEIELICSRCANRFRMGARPQFSALFCRDPVMAGVGHLEGKGKPAGQTKGFARHAHDNTPLDRDLDITYLSTDSIDLKDILTEQLQLQVPFQPLCREQCKGICGNCGADLNVGRCACAKIAASKPFAVLRNMKL